MTPPASTGETPNNRVPQSDTPKKEVNTGGLGSEELRKAILNLPRPERASEKCIIEVELEDLEAFIAVMKHLEETKS